MKFFRKKLKNASFLSVLILSLIMTSCESNSGGVASASIDLTGFTQTTLAGGGTKVTKADGTGKVLEEGMLINGKRNGTWITYYDNQDDRIKTIANYIDDQLNGQYLTFTNRGQIETKTNYVNGVYEGIYKKYRFGNVQEMAIYKNGQLNGMFKQYYDNNKIKLEAAYKNGKQHGAYKYYDEEGNVTIEYEYKDGEKVSGGLK